MDTQGKSSKTVNSKLAISKFSGFGTKSIGVTMRSMSKKFNRSSQMTSTEYVQKDLDSPSHASEDDGNESRLSSPRSMSSYSFTTNVAPIMVTNATIIEEQFASLTRAIEGLIKHIQEQDAQITRLINKTDNVDTNHIMRKQAKAHDEAKGNLKQHMAHFVKTCNNAGTYGDHLVRQFVRSLKGNAFDWYTDLEAGSIDG
ncbi:hypothetical protein Sango_0258000 [Sesamum angolense]|uniref:Ty3-gypsy retrotransposon protein n=1 Tax=Sesamum angolense TaxID=2727404 RepID=A0AAE1XHA1_9LAMI|nr:hypothetical protein Sango_0258000 [Sesamum angolense]